MNHHSYAASGVSAYSSRFLVKDPWSALTHFIGFIYSIILTPFILIHASQNHASMAALISLTVFMFSMMLLYGASTSYHTFLLDTKQDLKLKKMDHSMIFVLIAGSYTPVCVCILPSSSGLVLLAVIWGLAIAGVIFKLCWVTCPRWVSSVIYIGMGWSCVMVIPQLYAMLHGTGFNLLLIGGLVYTIGGVIYAMKFKVLNEISPDFGSHEIFHVCVMVGNLFHFAFMYMFIR